MSRIQYDITTEADPQELSRFYDRQHHQTTHSPEKLARMMAQSFCFITARRDGELIGLARGVTDGVRGYLVECKLDPSYQGPGAVTRTDGRIEHDEHGIAHELARRVIDSLIESGVERIEVLAYGTEVDFCEELGFKRCSGVVTLRLDAAAAAPQPVGPPN